jgi:hypothetical protein
MAGGHSVPSAFGEGTSRPPEPPARSGAASSGCPCARYESPMRRLASAIAAASAG